MQEIKKHSEKEDFQSALCGKREFLCSKLNSLLCCQIRVLARSIRLLVRLNRLPYAIKQTAEGNKRAVGVTSFYSRVGG